jgi:hypothetical protein
MSGLEQTIRPFADQDVTPDGYIAPGTVGVPPVRVTVGLKGGTKFFTTAASSSVSFRMGSINSEGSPNSAALQNQLATPADTG